MPSETVVVPRREEAPAYDETSSSDYDGTWIVILYNDDYHDMEEVVSQIQAATGYDFDRCIRIMFEAHTHGRAIAYEGGSAECERAAAVLRRIGLQVETDRR